MAVLKNHSEPGGLHEDTMLLVLGDHGQTLNGDHGGGTSEEVHQFPYNNVPLCCVFVEEIEINISFFINSNLVFFSLELDFYTFSRWFTW